MIKEYELSPNIDTLRHYILPALLKHGLSATQVISDLQVIGVAPGTATHAFVLYLLTANDIRQAADIGTFLIYYLLFCKFYSY